MGAENGKKAGRGSWDPSVEFFTKVAAVISHDFNNVLATMHEDVGLLHDYLGLAAKGQELDPDRLGKVAGRMAAQVTKGQEIMANMNRFAHSGDDALAEIELNQTVHLIGYFFRRPASAKGVTLELPSLDPEVRVLTNPFRLEELLWRCLEFAASLTAGGGCLILGAESSEEGALVEIRGMGSCTEDQLTSLEAGKLAPLLSELNACLKLAEGKQGIIIKMSDRRKL